MNRLRDFLQNTQRLLAAPVFPGDEQITMAARVLNAILLTNMVLWLLFFFPLLRSLAPLAIFFLMIGGGGLALLHRGYVLFVAYGFVGFLWLASTALIAISGGLINPETAGFVVVALAAGLLIGANAMFLYSGLCLLSVAVLYFMETQGLLPSALLPMETSTAVFIIFINLFLVTGLLYLVLQNLERALQQVRQGEQDALRGNQVLQDGLANLENKIAERTKAADATRQEAEAARDALEIQSWIVQGQLELNRVMRGDLDIQTLAKNIIQHICIFLNAPVGVLFLKEEDGGWGFTAGYAFQFGSAPLSQSELAAPGLTWRYFAPGEGLVGQAALDGRLRTLTLADIPADTLRITSGLGGAPPRQVILVPFAHNKQVNGVIELGVLTEMSAAQIEFLRRSRESIALAFNTAGTRNQVDRLLAETQHQAAELLAQQEELRAVNEELHAQAENLRDLIHYE